VVGDERDGHGADHGGSAEGCQQAEDQRDAGGVVLGVVGPGGWSLDDALDWFQPVPGDTGLWIVLVAGFGGAAALLSVFWRPQGDQ
jgi:hypothetical protein